MYYSLITQVATEARNQHKQRVCERVTSSVETRAYTILVDGQMLTRRCETLQALECHVVKNGPLGD